MTHIGYENRELSWLKFNARVLEEAENPQSPLLERLKFTGIFQSNLDEFFMVRVGSLYDQALAHPKAKDNKSGMTAKAQLKAIYQAVRTLEPQKDAAYHTIMQALSAHGLTQVSMETATPEERSFLETYFKKEVRPMIVPMIVDKGHPFPFLKNKAIYAALQLESKSGVKLGIIPVTEQFRRIIPLSENGKRFMLVDDLILQYAPLIFKNFKVIDRTLFRVTRSADIAAEEVGAGTDFRQVMEELIKQRKKLRAVRLQLSEPFNQDALDFLRKKLSLSNKQIFQAKAPLDLSFVFGLTDLLSDPALHNDKRLPQKSAAITENRPMIPQIKRHDILLSYPFESIRPFIRLLNEAANDKQVLSVQITLYRLARNSQVIEALCAAAENGIRVLVLVELRARFDEENNIEWSRRLQQSGCQILFGPLAYKVHSKLLLITRKTGDGVEYITQVGTGNYNENTSLLYTDLSLMTANREIGIEAEAVFHALCTETLVQESDRLLVAPLCLQNRVLDMIETEIQYAKRGEPAYIGLKLNSLTDKVIIDKLLAASCAGVRIDLVIRGICCLTPGIPGVSENITLRSIVGRFLEHSRIYLFGTAERVRAYIGSADFMTRNTIRRVEVAVQILDPAIVERILGIFKLYLADTVQARIGQPDGTYLRVAASDKPVNAQMAQYEEAYKKAEQKETRKQRAATRKTAAAPKPRKPRAKKTATES